MKTLRPRVLDKLALATALVSSVTVFTQRADAQGCVAIKPMGDATCGMDEHMMTTAGIASRFDLSINMQHFRSHRHFVGTDEQEQRFTAGSEVINRVEQVDVAVNYRINSRYSILLDLPYFYAERTSLYEHDRVNRFTTRAQGIGDMRVSGQMWLRNPISEPRGNIALSLGLKMPTGDTNAKDHFHTTAGLVYKTVDQSIQPGDGGWGITVGAQGFQRISERTSLYGGAFYLINPKETNGTYRSTNAITGRNAVPDALQVRAGVSQVLISKYNLVASLGGRLEGVPALDLIGGHGGYRRPGYVASVEPGISFSTGRDSFNLSVPIAVYRNRTRSYADMLSGGHGDAAFADFLINFGYSHRW